MKGTLYLIIAVPILAFGQPKEVKSITEKNVSRILKTLSADDMMGRPASDPTAIEKATAFIENEFKSIGLAKLTGLNTYRQGFTKNKIKPERVDIQFNGERVPDQNVFIFSENTSIIFSPQTPVKQLAYDSTIKNIRQFLTRLEFSTRDTTTGLYVVAPQYRSFFNELKGIFSSRFLSGRKGSKILVLGDYSTNNFSINVTQKVVPVQMNNVIGVIPGKVKPEELVIFSGHYDHIGTQKTVEGDSISNGADDDASGTTAVIELARYFKKLNGNNRTLLFVAFTAEEIGGYGSRYFSEQIGPDKVVAMFNIEMIGKESKFGKNAAFITGYERSDFGEILQKNLKDTPFKFHPDPYPKQNLFYRSDNATLARQGVPAHSISTDQIDIDKLYHTVNDEFESIDIDNVTSTIKAIALSSKSIVSGEDTPKRIDKTTER